MVRIYDSSGAITDNLSDGADIIPNPQVNTAMYFTLSTSKYKQLNVNDRIEVWLYNNTDSTVQVLGTSTYADMTYFQVSIVD
jgi:hypothetical protein